MPDYEEELRERTFKCEFDDDAEGIERRVYATLCGDNASDGIKPAFPPLSNSDIHANLHRIRRLVAFLAAKGVLSGKITPKELDEALFSLRQ